MKNHFNCKFDIQTENLICKLYQESIQNSFKSLAKRFNCHYNTIRQALVRNKIKIRTNSESQRGLRVGNNHPNFKGGNISKNGYRRIYVGKNLVLEHRHIMEKHIGRELRWDEVIHHINGNKLDNRIENLEIMDRVEHAHHHHGVAN